MPFFLFGCLSLFDGANIISYYLKKRGNFPKKKGKFPKSCISDGILPCLMQF